MLAKQNIIPVQIPDWLYVPSGQKELQVPWDRYRPISHVMQFDELSQVLQPLRQAVNLRGNIRNIDKPIHCA